jgi:hypothetical protein
MKTFKSAFSRESFSRPTRCRCCDWPDCGQVADYKAPKNRDNLKDYYWFCLNHVRAYNARWNYLAGLSEKEIEEEIRLATVWERPTWPLGKDWRDEGALRDALWEGFQDKKGEDTIHRAPVPAGEAEALAVLGLSSPCSFSQIKRRYRELAKRHHPDANGGSDFAQDKIKTINLAFGILRHLHEPSRETKEEK